MDGFLEDLGFALDDDDEDDEDGPSDSSDVLLVARRFKSGRSAAQLVYGDGTLNVGTGAMSLDWGKAVDHMLATDAPDERVELARALGQMSRVASHADPMRVAGVVAAMAELLMHDADDAVVVAAAEALGHLCCANAANRDAAAEAGVVPRLLQMLGGDLGTEGGVTAVGAAAAALRNLTYQHDANQAALCAGGGMELLLRVVATGEHRLGYPKRDRDGVGLGTTNRSPDPSSHPTPTPTAYQASRPHRRRPARRGARRRTAPPPHSRTSRPRMPTRRSSSRRASCPRCRRCCSARRPRR